MRTGAIFARGSCRALKWMALLGVVFALGTVPVAAQQTLSGGTLEIEADHSDEGGTTTITVTVSAEVESALTGAETPVTVLVTAAALDATTDAAVLEQLGATPAEATDWTLVDAETNLTFTFPPNTSGSSVRSTFTDTVVLQTRNTDMDAEDEGLRLTATATGLTGVDDPDTVDIRINDAQTQTYVLAVDPATQTPMEGGAAVTVTLKAEPAHVQGSERLTIAIDKAAPDYSIAITPGDPTNDDDAAAIIGNQVVIGTAAETGQVATATITLTHPANDVNRLDDTVMMTAHSGQPGAGMLEATLPIVLADANKLPAITAALTDANGMAVTDGMLTEGNTYMLTLTAVSATGTPIAAAEDITVSLMQASGTATSTDDYSLGQSLIMIPSGSMSSAAVSLEVDLNDDIDNDTLVFSAEVAGEAANGTETDTIAMLLSLTLVDATQKLITVAADADDEVYAAIDAAKGGNGMINPGELIKIPRAELFDTIAGYSARVSATSSDTAVAQVLDREGLSFEPEYVTIYPNDPGTAKITITGTAVPEASSFDSRNISADVAEIMFEVEVALAIPPVVQGLVAEAGDGEVTLYWDALDRDYSVTRYEYDVDASDEWMSAGTSTSATVTGLTNGTRYVFRVRAVNDAGAGESTAGVAATPVAAPLGPHVVVKSVSAATSVPEAGGLEVTVVATVPAGTKGADGKVAPIAEQTLRVWFPTDDASIAAGEEAEAEDLTVLGSVFRDGAWRVVWEDIPRTEKASEATFKFRVAIGQDLDAEDEKFQVAALNIGDGKKSKVITIDDAEEQTWVLSLPSAAKGAIKEGAAATKLTLEAEPAKTFNIPFLLELDPNDPSKYTLGGSARGFAGKDDFETTIAAKADSDRTDDTITVTAHAERAGELTSLDITVTDANALPAVKATLVGADGKALDPQPMSVTEGETVKVMLTVVDKDGKAMKAAEKLSVSLMPTGTADAADYRLSTHPIEIASGKESSAAVDLMIMEDQDLGDEDLTFDATVSGEAKNGTGTKSVMGVLSLMIQDATDKLVWAKTQAEVEAAIYAAKEAGMGDDMIFSKGEMIEVMGALLFNAAEGVTLSYSAASDAAAASVSVTGGMVMVTAMSEGMAHITITAHASMASGVMIVDQTDPGEASVMFPVEVGLEALSIMLTGPEDMNLVEGGMGAMVTATANREVTEDVTVMLMRDRAMSSADDMDFEAEPIMIEAGMMTGTTMVMAVEDDMMETMNNMPEELVLYGMTEGMAGEVMGEVKFYLWDAAVPALPLIAQLLLAAFLALGGYRRYRRR